MYSLRQKFALAWGKLRRAFLVTFRKGRVEEMLERRRGACARCGACCKLLLKCPAYDDSDGSPKCLVYNDRPGVCGLFPLDERDLRERDIIMPERKCGFTFEDPQADLEAPRKKDAKPLRWGPSNVRGPDDMPDPPGKPVWLKGSLAILWAQFNAERKDGPKS